MNRRPEISISVKGSKDGSQPFTITADRRAALKRQKPAVIWFTGLPASGKSTMANALDEALFQLGKHSCLIDGDNLRQGLNIDLGFSEDDRRENIRRAVEVAKLMLDAGLIVICALVSPIKRDRQAARETLHPNSFIEIFVDTPQEIAEQRDPKGLYARARSGQLADFTGVSSPYEAPDSCELRIPGTGITAQAVALIISELRARDIL